MDHHFKSRAAICDDALNAALGTIRTEPDCKDCFKFAIWHHPLESDAEDRITDKGFMERLTVNGFSVCFHGHIHQTESGLFRYEHGPKGRKIEIVGAGTQGRFYSGDADEDLDRVGWFSRNSGGKLNPVGQKEPNSFGLYDMHGNVWEWIEDDWHKNHKGAPEDGGAWKDEPRGPYRVIRGGGWFFSARFCRSAYRSWGEPGGRYDGLGFRLVLLPGQPG